MIKKRLTGKFDINSRQLFFLPLPGTGYVPTDRTGQVAPQPIRFPNEPKPPRSPMIAPFHAGAAYGQSFADWKRYSRERKRFEIELEKFRARIKDTAVDLPANTIPIPR
jgi:hypothetical protein